MASEFSATPAHRRGPNRGFDPVAHREPLLAIIGEIEALSGELPPHAPLSQAQLHSILRRYPRGGTGFFSRAELIAGFRCLAAPAGIGLEEQTFVARVRLRPVRTHSGVTPVTIFTRPFPCPGQCVFCPNDVRMPKSYLSDEPGCQRAEANRFDPYLQTYNRLAALHAIGHPTDKAEVIVLGGTWSFYPEAYQVWFACQVFEALNDFGAGRDGREQAQSRARFDEDGTRLDGRKLHVTYNQVVARRLRPDTGRDLLNAHETASWEELERAQDSNEEGRCRCVGFVVETRPDQVDEAEVLRLRRLGCTKLQIGLQSTSDRILSQNKRGHDVDTSRRAMGLLRSAGFKLHGHWMLNLLGSSADEDCADFDRMFDDPALRPDELKVYPCSLIESAELMVHYEAGDWQPYGRDELLQVLRHVLVNTPRYCRLSRVVRDIPSGDIVVGNRLSNFREVAELAVVEAGETMHDIRSREIRGRDFQSLRLNETSYEVGGGREVFLEFVSETDRILGLLRLYLPQVDCFIEEIAGRALIREVHVYGNSVPLGEQRQAGAQHRGLGRRLIERACQVACEAGYDQLAVISAVGTRPYYRSLGFTDGPLYQHRTLATD